MSEKKQYRTIPNRWVSVQLDATTQLTYAPLVNPAPLTASVLGGDPVIGSLEIVITNQSGATLQLSQVDFNIQVGSGASLTPSTANVLYTLSDTTTWSISGPSSTVTDGIATYSITPAQGLSAPLANGASLVAQIYDFQTNTTAGTSTIGIQETIGSDVNNSSFQVTTFPSGFFFDTLSVAMLQGSSFVAVAQVPFNTNVALFWNASVVNSGAVKIMQSTVNGQQTFTPTLLNEWTTPTPIQTDTIFTVQITTTATPGGVPLVASLSTSVAVQTPVLVATTLTVSGLSTLTGAVTAGPVTASSLTTTGSVSAGSTATGTLNVTGATTLAGATVTKSLQANQGLSASSASVTGGLTVQALATLQGGLNALGGPLAMLTRTQRINPGSYTASTDGFVVGVMRNASTTNYAQLSNGIIYGSIDGMTWRATGGNVAFFNSSWTKYAGPNANSFCMPVRKGAGWSISVWLNGTNEVNPITEFYWIPSGTTSSSLSLERHGDAEPPEEMRPLNRRVAVPKEHLIGELADLIDTLVEKPMSDEKRAKLRELLTLMNTDSFLDE